MDSKELKAIIKGKRVKTAKKSVNAILVLFSFISNYSVIKVSFFTFLLIIEWLQFLYLPIHYMSSKDYPFDVFTNIIKCVNYFKEILDRKSDLGIIVVICIHMGLIIFFIIASTIIICFGQKTIIKRSKLVSYTSTVLSSVLVFTVTVLLIPIFESFIFPITCFNGKRPLFEVSYMPCGEWSQILLSCFGIFFALLTSILNYITASVFVDDYWLSSLPWAGEGRDPHIMHEGLKMFNALYLSIDVGEKYAQIAILLYFLFLLGLIWKRIGGGIPYSWTVYVTKTLEESTLFAVYAYALLSGLYSSENTLWQEAFVFLIGLCIGVGEIMYMNMKRKAMIRKDWTRIKSLPEAEEYVKALCMLCFLDQGTTEWKLMIRYLVHIHCNECTKPDCQCKSLNEKEMCERNSVVSNADTHHKESCDIWLKIYEEILERQAKKWASSRDITMHLSYFESIMMKNYFKSYYWLLKASEMKIPFTERYIIFRKMQILARLIVMQESKTATVVNVVGILKFQKICNVFQRMLTHTTSVVISFWSLLENSRFNVRELYRKGQKITVMLKYVNDTFKQAVEINPDYPYNYFYYGKFTWSVLNSENYGADWIDKGNEILKQQKENRSKYKENISKSPDTAVIVISGNLGSLGMVQSANEHVQEQLGFAASDLIDRNISRVMPKAIGEVHDTFLLNNVKDGAGDLLKKELLVFIQTKKGLIEPVCLEAKTLPGLERGLQYIGFARRDPAKIKSRYVKLPSQHKGSKLAYILVDEHNYMLGLSKHACALFGLSTRYIMRKKGITNASYPISRLSSELDLPENEKRLEAGTEVALNTRSILEYLDYDYLKGDEVEAVNRQVSDSTKAYVMMMKLEYHDLVHLKVFIIADTSRLEHNKYATSAKHAQSSPSEGELTDDDILRDTMRDERRMSVESSQSQSYTSSQKGSQGSAIDIKKKASTNERTGSIKRLILAIFIFIGVLAANEIAIFGVFYSNMKDTDSMQDVLTNAFKRLTNFSVCICRLMSYLDHANGLEPNISESPTNYTETIESANYYIDLFKAGEYNLETTMNEYMPQLSSSVLYPEVELTKVQSDYTYYTKTEKLNVALIEILSVCCDITHRSATEVVSTNYVNSFNSSLESTLTEFEQRLVFLFANSLSSVHHIINNSSGIISNEIIKQIHKQEISLVILSSIVYGIVIIFAVIFAPTILRIYRNKRNLLMLFGEIPLSTIKKLNTTCKEFLRHDLSRLYDANSSFTSTAETAKNNTRTEEKKEGSDAVKTQEKDKEESKDDSKNEEKNFVVAGLLKPKSKDIQEKSSEHKSKEFEDADEVEKQRLKKAQEDKEGDFMRERKQSIKKVPLNLFKVTLAVIITFGCIIGYHTKIMVQVVVNYENTKKELDGTMILHRRFAYLTNVLFYYRAYLKSLEQFKDSVGCEANFNNDFDLAITNEKYVEDLTVFPPAGLDKLSSMLSDYDSSLLCSEIYVEDTATGFTTTWCNSVLNGLLQEGLSKTVAYFLTRTRDNYLYISLSDDVETYKLAALNDTEFQLIVEIFVRTLNPLFSSLIDTTSTIYSERKDYEINLMLLDLCIILFLMIIGLIVFIKYFIKRMEEELFMARGILALLPEKMIKSNSMLEALIEGHQLT